MKKIVFLSLSLLLLLVLIPGCILVPAQPPNTIPSVGTPPVIIEFSNNPSTINAGGTSTLLWNVTGATSVSIDQGIGQVNVAGTRVVSPATSIVYTISATNSAGTITRSAVTTVNSAQLPPVGTPPVIIVFSSNLNSAGTSTLLWNVTGATSVSIDQGIGQVNVAGIRVVSPATSTVYTISATNSAGTVTRSAATMVNSASPPPVGMPPIIIVFSSNLNSDGTSTLSWNVTGADSVSIDQGIGQVNVAGTMVVSPSTSTVYTISATNYYGTITGSAVTTVNSASRPVAPVPFAVTSVIATSSPSTFTGACPKTFTFYATFTANGPGTATYRWERDDLRYSNIQNITFNAAGTQTITMQWDLGETASGWYRVHILTPSDLTSLPVYYTLHCQ